jgi:hypothetical protein
MEQLLTEVHELRSDLNRAASVSLRTQLLVARLQLQEQRIDSLARQLADTRQQLVSANQAMAAMAQPLKALARAQADPALLEEQKALLPLSTMVASQQKRAEELRGQEGSLAALLSTEQSRWVELNDRLEEIERTLPPPKPR